LSTKGLCDVELLKEDADLLDQDRQGLRPSQADLGQPDDRSRVLGDEEGRLLIFEDPANPLVRRRTEAEASPT